ncbi:MAG: hypothetical protein AAGJ40_20460 [Planctomycetota bacterium]
MSIISAPAPASSDKERPDQDGQTKDRPIRRPREPVLVVLHHDGFVEVYANNANVTIVVEPHMESQQGERLARDYLAATLPRLFRSLYWPGKRVATGMVERVRPSDLMRRTTLSRLLSAIGTVSDPESTRWVV